MNILEAIEGGPQRNVIDSLSRFLDGYRTIYCEECGAKYYGRYLRYKDGIEVHRQTRTSPCKGIELRKKILGLYADLWIQGTIDPDCYWTARWLGRAGLEYLEWKSTSKKTS